MSNREDVDRAKRKGRVGRWHCLQYHLIAVEQSSSLPELGA